MTGGLAVEEEAQLIALLSKMRQPYSRLVTTALSGVMPVIAIELVILRRYAGRLKVLMTQRSDEPGDPWPGMFHCPGTLLRDTDANPEAALHNRLVPKEVGVPVVRCHFLYHRHQITAPGWPQGPTLQLVYGGEVVQEPPNGRWYDVDDLPPGTIPVHAGIVTAAVHMYPFID